MSLSTVTPTMPRRGAHVRSVVSEGWTQFRKPVIRETNGGVTVTAWGMESPLLGETPVIPMTMDLDSDQIDNLSDGNLGRLIDNGFLYLFSGDCYDDLEYFPRSVRLPAEDEDEDGDADSESALPSEH